MSERVTIVLNEREPAKASAAQELERRLLAEGITSSRLQIDDELVPVLLRRKPQVLVLDYLLGDHTSGLDVLHSIKSDLRGKDIQVVFLTDEPSVAVAVEALRSGAHHYIELDRANALTKVIDEVKVLLERAEAPAVSQVDGPQGFPQLVASDPRAVQLHNDIRSAIVARAFPVVLLGAAGSGLSTLARAAALEVSPRTPIEELDLSREPHPTALLVERLRYFSTSPVTPVVIIEHLEDDDGQLRHGLSQHDASTYGKFPLILTTTSEGDARCWTRAHHGTVIQVPALHERRQDIAPLAQRFAKEAVELLRAHGCGRTTPFATELLSEIAAWEWPGNIRQLRSAIISSIVQSTLFKGNQREILQRGHDHHETPGERPFDKLEAALLLEHFRHDWRRTAVQLGCSLRTLRACLTGGAECGEAR